MRKLRQPYQALFYFLGLAIVIWTFLVLSVLPMDPLLMRVVHLSLAMLMVFMGFPANRNSPRDRPTIVDWLWCIIPLVLLIYVLPDFEDFQYRTSASMHTQMDLFLGILVALAALEMVRRVSGMALIVVAGLAIAYAVFGSFLPGTFGHRGYPAWRIIGAIFSEEGVLGPPIQIAATYALLLNHRPYETKIVFHHALKKFN